MYVDDPLILELLALLKAHGVRRIVISPGSRHYPIVRSLEADPDFQLYSVVDERSAAFFAMGVIHATGEPTAVLTTSGTAAVNLASAVADAFYQRLPLVAITADRLPQLLNQMEDQMVDQTVLFEGTLRARANLRVIQGDIDHWYDNRVLNEALLAMRVNGSGPVHINVPIANHTGLSYSVSDLPAARVISHHTPSSWRTDWREVTERLSGKRVMIMWGQGAPPDQDLLDAVEFFTSRTDSIIVADLLGNLHHPAVLDKGFPALATGRASRGELTPDIVITLGGTLFLIDEVKSLLKQREVEHWRVDPDGLIVDPFWQLTDVFQIDPIDFLRNAVDAASPRVTSEYRATARSISETVAVPRPAYGETAVITEFLAGLPEGCALHIGNSAAMRMAHLSSLPPEITVLGNRGVNGIDGSMSATVGFAAASGRLTYLVLGDLSFFYDMNALGIRDLPPGLRVLVINNGGGALMHAPTSLKIADQVARHTSAGHDHTVEGWVRSLCIEYLHADDSKSVSAALSVFLDPHAKGPLVLEVMTEKVADIRQLKDYYSVNSATGNTVYRKARALAGRTLRKLGVRG